MSEKRKPDLTFTVITAKGLKRRYELFEGDQFADRMTKVPFFHAEQPTLQLLPVDLANTHYVRVRCDGRWLPTGRRALFPLQRVSFLIGQELQSHLRRRTE